MPLPLLPSSYPKQERAVELAKKPPECLEFIVVHELVHLHERKHNQ
ncbi:YgjP-like metallopeptidase domain-containing protein [Aeromonas salmonicida]